MGIMGTDQEQNNWYTHEELLRRCVLSSIIDLLPHVQIVVGTCVEFEWYTTDPMKHEE